MAKQEKITLTLDFDVERAKLQGIGDMLSKDLSKGLKGDKTTQYFNSAKEAATDLLKTVNSVYSTLSKPLVSKAQGKELGNNLQNAFKGFDNKLLSLQGNIGKTFGSIDNAAALKKIRQLGDEIDNLRENYQAYSNLFSKSKSLGSKTELSKQLKDASKEYEILANKQTKLTTEETARQKELKEQIDSINKALEEKAALQERMNNIHTSLGVNSQQELSSNISSKIEEQQGLINGSVSIQDAETLKNVLTEIRKVVSDIMSTSNATSAKIEDNIRGIEEEARAAAEQARTFKSVLRDLGIPILSLNELASTMKNVVSYSYNYIKNLDAALTEISVVSGKTRAEVMDLTDTFIELSAKTGMAIDDIAQASTIFYQQGLNDAAVKQLTEWTALFAKISGEDVPTAADQITAAINGFGYSYNQVEDVVDKMSVLAAHSAASIDELATAMSKAASQANQAGLSFDEYNAYLATMIEATREAPENIGTSMKTIMSRMQQIKTGENTEDDVDVNQVEKALKSVGIQLRNAEGQLKDLDEVLGELGPKWATLDRNSQAYLGTIIAGTRQQSRFITLMQNWDRVLELTADSERSAGAATKMHEAAMEGLDASLNNLTNAWQKLISSMANGDSFKWLIDALTGLVKWLGDGNAVMKILTMAIVAWDVKTVAANITATKMNEKIKNLDTGAASLGKQFKKLKDNILSLTKPMNIQTEKVEQQKEKVDQLADSYDRLADKEREAANVKTGGSAPKGNDSGDIITDTIKEKVDIKIDPEVGEAANKTGASITKLGGKLKTFGKNVVGLMGGIQTAISAGVILWNTLNWLDDKIRTTSDEIREAAQESYDATQAEIDKRVDLINTVETNLEAYNKLSKKMNKSSEEVEELAKAADELAKAAPGALVGYDENGNPIIDPAKAAAEKAKAEKELVEEAKNQIANVGNLARADLKEQAEKNWSNSKAGKAADTGQAVGTAGVVAGGGALAGMWAAGLALDWNPAGWMITAAAAIATLGLAVWGVSEATESAGVSQEEYNLALEKAAKISDENRALLLENMSYITNSSIKNNTVGGVSESDRTSMANYIGGEWLNQQTSGLFKQLATGAIDEEEYEKAYKNLGNEWQKVLQKIDDNTLALAYKNISNVAKDIGDKTYSEVETAITSLITNQMHISKDDPLFQVLHDSFLQAAYSGTEDGIYGVIADLKGRKLEAEASGNTKQAEQYGTAINNAKNMTNNELGFYSSTGITDNVNLFNDMVEQYGPKIREALVTSTEAAAVDSIAILSQYRDEALNKLDELAQQTGADSYEEIDYDALTDKQKYYYDYWISLANDSSAAIENAWNKLAYSSEKTWSQLWETYEKITDRAKTAWETWHKVASGEGLDYSSWKEFTTMLDDIDFSAFSTDQLNDYSAALDEITDSLKIENGQLYMNGKAVENLAQLEQSLAEQEIQRERTVLMNKKYELEANKAIIDAQVATLQYQIAAAKGSAEAEGLKTQAQEAWVNASNKMNTFYVKNNAKVTEAIVGQFSSAFTEIAGKFNQLQTAMADGKITKGEIGNLQKEWKALQKDLTFENYEAETSKLPLAELESQLQAAQHLSSEYSTQISNIDLKLKTLGMGMNYTKEGVVGGKDDQEKANTYIGKLKEIYNIMNKIEREESRLSDLEAFGSVAHGKDYIDYLQRRVNLTETLRKDYEQLIKEQKNLVVSEQEAIKNSPVGDVFSFDEYGAIVIDYDKYLKLQDQEIDGKKSLKELADNLYDEYEEYYDTLKDNYSDYIKYLEAEIDLEQEKVDTYVDLQHDLAEAVKDIYQDMLDNRLEAIDKEKEALDDLKEAYEEANKANKDSKEISKMQTGLKRSMMDTSGASNTKVLSYQDQLQTKLEEMGEDQYTKRLDGIKEALDDEKDALQKEFDEYFKDYEKLYNMIDGRIMGNEEAVKDVLMTTDTYLKANAAERAQLIDTWDTNYHTAMDGIADGATIMDVVQHISDLKDTVGDLDTTLGQQVDGDRIGKEISTALTEWLQSQNKEKDSGGSGGSGGSSGGYGGVGPLEDIEMEEAGESSDLAPLDTSKLEEVQSWWDGFKDSVGGFFSGLWDGIANFFTQTLPGFISSIPEKLGELGANIINFLLITVPGAILSLFGKIVEFILSIPGMLANMYLGLTQGIADFWTMVQGLGDKIIEFIRNLPSNIVNMIQTVIGWVVNGVTVLITTIGNIIQRFFTSLWNNLDTRIQDALKWIWDIFDGTFQSIFDFVGGIFDGIVDKVSGAFEAIKTNAIEPLAEFFSWLWNGIFDGAKKLWDGITNIFGAIPQFFHDKFAAAWQYVIDIFSTGGKMFAGISDGLLNAVKGVVNKLIDGINWVVKQPFKFLNGILNSIRNIGFLGIEPFKGLWKQDPISAPEIPKFKTGGFADFTGPAWLDGTKSAPEAVLNAEQTKAFMKLANNLDKFDANGYNAATGNSINIESIEFKVDSMSSVEDGEIAFDAFVQKFKEIGSQKGLHING